MKALKVESQVQEESKGRWETNKEQVKTCAVRHPHPQHIYSLSSMGLKLEPVWLTGDLYLITHIKNIRILPEKCRHLR